MSAVPFRPDTADLAATVATRQDVLVTLISEVARNYFELRGAQNQLAVARGNVENERETLDLDAREVQGRTRHRTRHRPRARPARLHAGLHPAAGSRRQTLHLSLGRPHRTAAHRPGIGACPAGPHSGPAAAGQHRQPRRPAAPAAGHPLRRKLPGRRHRAHRRRDRRPLPARHLQRQPRRAGQRSLRPLQERRGHLFLWPQHHLGRPGPRPRPGPHQGRQRPRRRPTGRLRKDRPERARGNRERPG